MYSQTLIIAFNFMPGICLRDYLEISFIGRIFNFELLLKIKLKCHQHGRHLHLLQCYQVASHVVMTVCAHRLS